MLEGFGKKAGGSSEGAIRVRVRRPGVSFQLWSVGERQGTGERKARKQQVTMRDSDRDGTTEGRLAETGEAGTGSRGGKRGDRETI